MGLKFVELTLEDLMDLNGGASYTTPYAWPCSGGPPWPYEEEEEEEDTGDFWWTTEPGPSYCF